MWSKLLSPLRIEPTPEADFESRFIEDFHRRLKQESARVSLMSRLVERAKIFIADFSCRRWAAAAATVLVTAFVLGSLMLPDADVPKTFASVGTPGEQVVEPQKPSAVDIVPSALSNRDGVMASKLIVPIHEVAEMDEETSAEGREVEKKEEKKEEIPAEIKAESAAE